MRFMGLELTPDSDLATPSWTYRSADVNTWVTIGKDINGQWYGFCHVGALRVQVSGKRSARAVSAQMRSAILRTQKQLARFA